MDQREEQGIEEEEVAVAIVNGEPQHHHQNCKPEITSHNQTQIEKEKEEEWEWEDEDEDAEDVRKKKVENKEIESVRDILESLVRWWDRWEIIIKSKKNDYLNKVNGRIDKLM